MISISLFRALALPFRLALVIACTLCVDSANAEIRTWTSIDGRVASASCIGFSIDHAIMLRNDGELYCTALEQFSEESKTELEILKTLFVEKQRLASQALKVKAAKHAAELLSLRDRLRDKVGKGEFAMYVSQDQVGGNQAQMDRKEQLRLQYESLSTKLRDLTEKGADTEQVDRIRLGRIAMAVEYFSLDVRPADAPNKISIEDFHDLETDLDMLDSSRLNPQDLRIYSGIQSAFRMLLYSKVKAIEERVARLESTEAKNMPTEHSTESIPPTSVVFEEGSVYRAPVIASGVCCDNIEVQPYSVFRQPLTTLIAVAQTSEKSRQANNNCLFESSIDFGSCTSTKNSCLFDRKRRGCLGSRR